MSKVSIEVKSEDRATPALKKISPVYVVTFHGKDGEYLTGIPRRNLTQEMWDLVLDDVKARALKSKLYKLVKKDEKEK